MLNLKHNINNNKSANLFWWEWHHFSLIYYVWGNKQDSKERRRDCEIKSSAATDPSRQITGDDTYHLISANKNLITAIMA